MEIGKKEGDVEWGAVKTKGGMRKAKKNSSPRQSRSRGEKEVWNSGSQEKKKKDLFHRGKCTSKKVRNRCQEKVEGGLGKKGRAAAVFDMPLKKVKRQRRTWQS